MKRIILLLIAALLSHIDFYGQTPTPSIECNYVMTVTPIVAVTGIGELNINKATYNIRYFDGLGRLVQTIQPYANPGRADLVTYQEYDAFGRESNNWLPVVAAGNSGASISFSDFQSKASSTYMGDSKPYSKPVYELSPFNRIAEQYGPGQVWHNNSRSVKTVLLTNEAGVDTLNCIRYEVSYSSLDTMLTVTRSGNYDTGQLTVTRVSDEDGRASFEFKDKQGKTILIRQAVRNGSSKDLHDTYYIYDIYGNLAVVLSPLASDAMRSGTSWSSTADIINKYAYLYTYDHRNRCKSKKIPGCNWILYIYDKADRLIFTQDGNQRNKSPKEWTFTIPDKHGRIVLTGTSTDIPQINSVNNTVIYGAYPQSGTGPYMGYNISGMALSVYTILSTHYYDHYRFLALSGFSNASLSYESSGVDSKFLTRYGLDTNIYEHKGLLTGTLTAQLSNSGNLSYLYSVLYYDYRGQMIQSKSTNHLAGGIEKEYVAYNFAGQPEYRSHIHSATNASTQTELYSYTYDHAGRPLTTKHRLNSGVEIILANNIYDELGRLKSSQRNGQTALTTNYTYNIRSWVKSISTGNLFSQTLYYNDSYGGNKPCYNGNISAMTWTVPANNVIKGYRFAYDPLSRLTSADYLENGVTNSRHNTSYTYDKHGNITALTRSGHTGTSTYGIVDNLAMTYNGNQLIKVTDTGTTPSISTSADFRSGSAASVQYLYDANGNLKQDLNKGIGNIAYNSLNLPSSFTISNSLGSATNAYAYSADGRKLKVTKGTFTTDYVGNVIYENDSLKRILVDGGYYENGTYYFYLTDHLGNNRVVTNQSGAVIQSTQYYPFGMAFADGTDPSAQPYKFGGKELESDRGLNLYDFHARWQDAALGGRFLSVDPLAEKYYSVSPYVYCMNNPVRFVDPDGRDWWSTNDPSEIERILLQLKTKEKVDTESFGSQWIHVTDQELAKGMGIFDDESLDFTVNGESWENVGSGVNSGMGLYDLNFSENEYIDTKHLIGPSLAVLGKQLNFLKPVGYMGSKTGSSIASYTLSKLLPINIGKRGSDLAKLLIGVRTTNLGRFVGRMFPGLGWGITAVDTQYSLIAKPNIQQIQQNIVNGKNPLDGVINPTTGEYYVPSYLR